MPGSVKVGGVWRDIETPSVKVGGTFHTVDAGWVKVGGVWRQWFTGIPPLAPGTYVLPNTAGGGGFAFVEADTTPYRGRITELRVRISYGAVTIGKQTGVSGRPNGNFYRNLTGDLSWVGATIRHRIDTWDATSLDDFNSGAAIGYTYTNIQAGMTNSQVEVTIT